MSLKRNLSSWSISLALCAGSVAAQPNPGGSVGGSDFAFTGNTQFSAEQLQSVLREFGGRRLSLAEVYAAADRVTDWYVAHGYTLAAAAVPPQQLGAGPVRLQLIEGKVGAVKLEGTRRYRADTLNAYLDPVSADKVYHGPTLEQSLLRLNQLPGLSTRARLRPGARYGENDVVVVASEDAYAFSTTLDNYGRESTGEFRLSASGDLNNPLRLGDQLRLSGTVSEEALMRYGYAEYSLPVLRYGTRLILSYGYADFEVDDKVFDGLEGKNKVARLRIEHPLLLGAFDVLTLSLGGRNTQADADLFGAPLPRDTDLSLLELGAQYRRDWINRAQTQIDLGFSSNFEEATAETLNRPDEDDDQRLRSSLNLWHYQPLPASFDLVLQAAGLWSPDPLADTEQFYLGGPFNVRGYPSGEVRGDRGYFGSISLRRPFWLGTVSVTPSVFADSGRVRRVEIAPGLSEEDSLSSVGAGVELRYRQWSARLDGSVPTDNHPPSDDRDDFRAFGSLTVGF